MSTTASLPLAAGVTAAAPARVKWLAAPSSDVWLEQALALPELLLIDHAHCERKAAGVALQLMFRYPPTGSWPRCSAPWPVRSSSTSSGCRLCWSGEATPCAPWRPRPTALPWLARCGGASRSACSTASWWPA